MLLVTFLNYQQDTEVEKKNVALKEKKNVASKQKSVDSKTEKLPEKAAKEPPKKAENVPKERKQVQPLIHEAVEKQKRLNSKKKKALEDEM